MPDLLVGAFFVIFGNLAGRLRPSWFVGLRTPWTLSSDEVWRRTHRLLARLMVACGIAMMIAGLFLSRMAAGLTLLAALVLVVLLPALMSYVWWRRLAA